MKHRQEHDEVSSLVQWAKSKVDVRTEPPFENPENPYFDLASDLELTLTPVNH